MLVAADYPFLEVLWTMLVFFAWVSWFWFLISVASDVFRRHDIGGGKKTVWLLFMLFVPIIGVVSYLVANGDEMAKRNIEQARAQRRRSTTTCARSPRAAARPRKSTRRRSSSTPARSLSPSTRQSRRRRSRPERPPERRKTMTELGPVDYMIVAFPGNDFRGEIAPALADLVESGTIRIIDLAFVAKDAEGKIGAFELTEIEPEVREGFENLGIEVNGLFNEDDLTAAAEELEPNSSAALLVWENVWAKDVAQALRDAGGVLLDFERLPHEVVQAAREAALANV
jgi:hypothetical protein